MDATWEENDHVSKKYATFQEFLDQQQYSRESILSYEKIFGHTYVSTGGESTTKEFCSLLPLEQGQHVLDVGCGIGGSAFYMAKNFGAKVTGIDLSSNMLAIAKERSLEVDVQGVSFHLEDATKVEYESESFDVIYSRDAILHIEDKKALFQRFLKWLRPGGQLLLTDYCCKDGTWSEEYAEYVKARGYYVISVQQYVQLLKEVGFVNVQGWDKTDRFVQTLHEDLDRIKDKKEEFLQDGLGEENFEHLVQGWRSKLKRTSDGDQRWGLFLAEKGHQ